MKSETTYVDKLLEYDGESYRALVRLNDSRYVVGISLHPGMQFLPLQTDAYLGNSLEEAKAAYDRVAGKRKPQ